MNEPIELKKKYIDYYKDVPIQKYAAMAVGRNEDTILVWKHDDSDFSDKVEAARAEWIKSKVKQVNPSFALERMEKAIFSERKELTGADNKPIPIVITEDEIKDAIPSNNSTEEDTQTN